MLENNMVEQLKSAFSKLDSSIELVYSLCDHPDQKVLLELLESIVATSSHLHLKASTHQSEIPEFHLETMGLKNGISFKGIPNGHEFTSLVLAVLNSNGKGKFPDEMIIERIKKLKGPIELQTYVSLTCENCPDVVQILNQMAILHGNFSHQMVDGAYFQDDLKKLGIQGVPSVISNSKLIYSGKLNLIDLLKKLEEAFGIDSKRVSSQKNNDLGKFDLVVIGAGPSGSAAAIYSARKGLRVAVVAEKLGGQVAETKGIENLISVKYTEGPALVAQLNQHIGAYPIKIFEHRRVNHIDPSWDEGESKQIFLEGGEYINTQAIIIATGAKWRELNVPGEKEYLGRGVAFCPHCDGPYYKNKVIAVVGGGNSGVEAAIDLAGIVKEVTVIEFNEQLKADKVLTDKLYSLKNVKVISNAKIDRVLGDEQRVNGLQFNDRKTNELKTLTLDGIFVQIGLLPNTQFLKGVLELSPFGEIVIDAKGRTSVKNIYASGDVTTIPFKQIVIAIGEGAKAALTAFEDQMLKM